MTEAEKSDVAGSVAREKEALRRTAMTRRAAAHADRAAAAAEALAERVLDSLADRLADAPVVAVYWSMRDEIDVRPLMAALAARGAALALPVMRGRARPLEFRRWRAGDALVRGTFGVDEPTAGAPAVRPGIVIVPMLAFDTDGNRLGYGGGYYDRTLRALRAEGDVFAVAVGYDEQELPAIPAAPWDEKIDMIVTDRRCLSVATATRAANGT